jgi:3-hydroxypropanoate dehydrogenase
MLDAHALDVLFREAHSTHAFTEPVTDPQIRALYDLLKWGPTTLNTQPGRFVFVR